MAKPGLVIFDCDGVLVDSEHASFEVPREMAAELDIELTFEQNKPYFGTRDSDMFESPRLHQALHAPQETVPASAVRWSRTISGD